MIGFLCLIFVMDINQYISSGILEAYLLGNLPEREKNALEQLIEQHDTLKEELIIIQNTLEAMAQQLAVVPEDSTRGDILEKLHRLQKEQAAKRQPMHQRWAMTRFQIAASIIWLVIMFSAPVYFYLRLKKVQTEFDEALSQNKTLSAYLSVVRNPDFAQISLAETETSPGQYALVFWNPTTGEVYLDAAGLSATDPTQQYQLWALQGEKPVSMGVFDSNEEYFSVLEKMETIRQADAFAVTLEPRGGSRQPTLSALQVMGKVSS